MQFPSHTIKCLTYRQAMISVLPQVSTLELMCACQISRNELKAMMKIADVDGSQTIELAEFARMMGSDEVNCHLLKLLI